MPRKKETLETRLRRHLPGIDIRDRKDRNHWIWEGKLRSRDRRHPRASPLLGDLSPTRLLFSLWLGEPLHYMVRVKRFCGEDFCVNPYHHVLIGCLYNRYDTERFAVPYHEHMVDAPQFDDDEDIREAIESIPGYETMSVDELTEELRGICTRQEIENALGRR